MNNRLLGILLISVGLLLGLMLTPTILLSNTGGVSSLLKYFGIFLGFVTLFRPSTAPWLLTILFFTQDYSKKVAAFYGIASEQLLYEVMGVSYGVCLAAALGSLVSIIRRKESPIPALLMYVIGAAITFLVLVIGLKDGGLMDSGYNAAAFGLPSVIATLIFIYFSPDLRKVENLIKFQFVLSFIWTIVALKQIYFGFSEIDHSYMQSGLSPVASAQYFGDLNTSDNPRPFGLGSGSPSLNSIACFGFYGIWRAFSRSNVEGGRMALLIRLFYLIGGLLICLTMFEGRLKTSAACLVLCWGFYLAYRNKWLTFAFYVSGVAAFILLVMNSTYFLDNIAAWDSVVTGKLGDTFSIQTFSDRLKSFETLKNPEYYTLFGTQADYFVHDFFSLILVKSGVVGLSLLLIMGFTGAYYIHSWTWKLPKDLQPFYVALLTMFIPFTALIGLGGRGDLHVTPNNIRIWTLVGCIIVTIVRVKQARASLPVTVSESSRLQTPAREQGFNRPPSLPRPIGKTVVPSRPTLGAH